MRLAFHGVLQLLACHPSPDVGGLLRRERTKNPRHQQPIGGADVGVPGDEPDVLDPRSLDDLGEVLQLAGPARQAVDVVHDHRVHHPIGHVGQQALVLGASLAGVGRQVVVDVLPRDDPSERLGQVAAVLHLSRYSCAAAVDVAGDPRVDCRCSGRLGHGVILGMSGQRPTALPPPPRPCPRHRLHDDHTPRRQGPVPPADVSNSLSANGATWATNRIAIHRRVRS